MATIGSLGEIVFSVSPEEVKTFEDMKWNSSARYTTHNRHLKEPLIEFTGTNTDTISFKINLSVFLGVDPTEEIEKLLDAERNGTVMRLILGYKVIGRNKWVIEKLAKTLEKFDKQGNVMVAKVTITLKEYARR